MMHSPNLNENETTSMISQPNHQDVDFKGYQFIIRLMTFTPIFFIVFYVPHPIFAIMKFLEVLSPSQYDWLQVGYMTFMCILYATVNTYAYYKFKQFKRQEYIQSGEKHHLDKIFNNSDSNLVNPKNLMKILLINSASIIALTDTAFDIVFVALCYGSGVVWLAVLVGLSYIYTFFDKVHSLRKIFGLIREQKRKRFQRSILFAEPNKAIQFYSACLSILAFPMGETLTKNHLKTLNLQRRVLLFEAVHIAIQKVVFMLFKVGYSYSNARFKSDMTRYAIPMNIICAVVCLSYIFYKFREMRDNKLTNPEDLSNSGSQVKKFHSQVTSQSIRFRENEPEDLLKLEQVIQEIEESRRKQGASLNNQQTIDKLKVKLLEGDQNSFKSFLGIIKNQQFLREISFYKMRFQTEADFECLSKIMSMRKQGLTKVSFKECNIKENLVGHLIPKQTIDKPHNQNLIKDLTLQLKVSEETDYELLYQQLRGLVDNNPIQILFEPLFYSKRRDDNIFTKLSKQPMNLLGETQFWPQAITSEYQHIKRYYLVQSGKANTQGYLSFFKDRNLQLLFDRVMTNKIAKRGGELDLSNIRDVLTHSYHQERFVELLLRGIEDNVADITHLQVRLINDQAFYDKFSTLGIRISHFNRLIKQLSDNQLVKLHLNMSDISVQDTKSLEFLFQILSDLIELQSKSLKEISFTGASFDLNSNAEKDFFTSLSYPNLTKLVLTNCKFVCYDSFERFFSNLSDTENSIKHLEISRVNSSVSAKVFKDFLLSQQNSIETLILQGVHKNIMSRKYHKKVLPCIAAMTNLKHLSLRKNLLDNDKLQVISNSIVNGETFQELKTLDLAQNLLENMSILTIYKLLKERQFSLDSLDLSENSINEEGLNLLLKGKTDNGGYPLTKGLLANSMFERNYLINNSKASILEIIEVGGSFAAISDPSLAVSGFQMLGILNNKLTQLNISSNYLSQQQVQVMLDKFLLSKYCSIVSLNLSNQRFDEMNIESLQKYISSSTILQNLNLNDCRLRDSFGAKVFQAWLSKGVNKNSGKQAKKGELLMEGNMFGEQLFSNVMDEMDEVEGSSSRQNTQSQPQSQQDQQLHHLGNALSTGEPLILLKVSFAKNNLSDETISIDLLRVLTRSNTRIIALDFSNNPRLGKSTLIHLRYFLESPESEILAMSTIDLSENPQCLKSASIMEMRQKGAFYQTEVKYTREQPKPKKEKRAKKSDKK